MMRKPPAGLPGGPWPSRPAPGPLRRAAQALGALLALLPLAACDDARVARLEEGVATEADVRRQFGTPAAEYLESDGSRTLEYPRQPEGRTNYMITIGPDGRMSALRQVLKPADFAQVRPGMDRPAVRRLLGQPARQRPYPLQQAEEWTWYWLDGQDKRVHTVRFDAAGQVVSSQDEADLRDVDPGR